MKCKYCGEDAGFMQAYHIDCKAIDDGKQSGGRCKHCGVDVWFMRQPHKECKAVYDVGQARMAALATDAALNGYGSPKLRAELQKTAADTYPDAERVEHALVLGWMNAAEIALDDHLLSVDEERALDAYVRDTGISPHYFGEVKGAADTQKKLGYSRTLRDLNEGVLPDPAGVWALDLPFNFMKSETPVWAFEGVRYLEDKVQQERVGESLGGAVPVGKGVYIHGSQFRSRTVETEVTEHVDTGTLAVTTKNLYFSGRVGKKLRIPYDRVVAFDAYPDGIVVTRDEANARSQRFIVERREGWFLCNLVAHVSQE